MSLQDDSPFDFFFNFSFAEDPKETTGFQRPLFRKRNLSLIDLNSSLLPDLDAVSGSYQVCLIIFYAIASAFSLLGNLTAIVVLIYGRRSSVKSYLINLAISDIAMATFCIPFSFTNFMYRRWVFTPEFCPIVAFMQNSSVTCSVYTLVAIGIDRFKALKKPLNSRWTKTKPMYVILGIWIFAFSFSSIQIVIYQSEPFTWRGLQYYECRERWPFDQQEIYEKVYTVALFFITFGIPMIILSYTYLTLIIMMCLYQQPGSIHHPIRERQMIQAKKKVINMMMAVVLCFLLSWLPYHVLQFIIYFKPEVTQCSSRKQCSSYYTSFFACHWIAMANSFMNPFIYCFMCKNFREDLIYIFRKCTSKASSPPARYPSSREKNTDSVRMCAATKPTATCFRSSTRSYNPMKSTRRNTQLELRLLNDEWKPSLCCRRTSRKKRR